MTLRVLIAEDAPLFAWDLQDVIEEAGHEVCARVSTVKDMLGMAEASRPDVAFVDLQLADGFAVEAVKRLSERFGTKIVLTTGIEPDDTFLESLDASLVAVLIKPVTPQQIATALQKL